MQPVYPAALAVSYLGDNEGLDHPEKTGVGEINAIGSSPRAYAQAVNAQTVP